MGLVIVMGAGAEVFNRPEPGLLSHLPAAIALLAGALMVIGLATPIAAFVAMLEAAGILFSSVPASGLNPYASKVCCLLVTVSSAAVVLLGPGAFSIDARLFGWHEVILPPRRPGNN